MPTVVSAEQLTTALRAAIIAYGRENPGKSVGCVTGPGRSGAVAAVIASHMFKLPYLPFGQRVPEKLRPVLIVDTAVKSGATLRKAARQYAHCGQDAATVHAFKEPPRVVFWYEVQ